MRRVVIESPSWVPDAAERGRNLRYLRACLADCLGHGDAPFAAHGLYTQPGVLDDSLPVERDLGIRAGFRWRDAAHATIVYTDLGVTEEMNLGIADAVSLGHPVEYRTLGPGWEQRGRPQPLTARVLTRVAVPPPIAPDERTPASGQAKDLTKGQVLPAAPVPRGRAPLPTVAMPPIDKKPR